MKHSLENSLLEWLQENSTTHKKVHLYVLGDEWGYSPESVARSLRRLAETGKIHVTYYQGKFAKNLAQYSAEKPKPVQKSMFKEVIINGRPVMVQG